MNPWLMLALAIGTEVIATSSLKLAAGFTKPLPSLLVVLGYIASFWLLSQVLLRLDLGVVYAIWCGVGIAVVATVGVTLAAAIGVFVRDLVKEIGGRQVGTVGSITLHPNLTNVVAARAQRRQGFHELGQLAVGPTALGHGVHFVGDRAQHGGRGDGQFDQQARQSEEATDGAGAGHGELVQPRAGGVARSRRAQGAARRVEGRLHRLACRPVDQARGRARQARHQSLDGRTDDVG